MSAPNAVLAYRVMDDIDADPESHFQEWWFVRTECGTTACFAGRTCLLSGGTPYFPSERGIYSESVLMPEGPVGVPGLARRLLGIDFTASCRLFQASNTRWKLRALVAEIFGPRPDYGTGCSCDWLGVGTPEHAPSALCKPAGAS